MKLRRALPLFLAPLVLATQGEIVFQDPQRSLVLRNFAQWRADLQGPRLEFGGTGEPLIVELRDQGIVIRGRRMDGVAVRGTNDRYTIQSANVETKAEVELDTAMAAATAAERAKAAGNEPGNPQPEQSVTTLTSDTIRYAGSETEGRVDVPGPFTLVSRGEGRGTVAEKTKAAPGQTPPERKIPFTYVQTFNATGTRGTLTLDPRPEQERRLPLRTGVVEGPVEFTFARTETLEGVPAPRVTTAKGRADRMEFGVAGDGYTLTATGNVQLDSEGQGALGRLRGERMVITLDKDLKPIRYEASGAPARVQVTPNGKG